VSRFRLCSIPAFLAALLSSALPVPCQETPAPPALINAGTPITIPFQCTEEEMDWAGLTCTVAAPCSVYLEISAVESIGDNIFAAGNIHSDAQTLYSVLLVSEDAGRTWREAHARIRGAGLDRVVVAGPGSGWVSGQTLSPLAGDPFFLLTRDGGKSWRKQAVFSDGRAGAVLQFYFPDSDTGQLTYDTGPGGDGDRYEIYQTADGGFSWTIKETSARRPALPPPPPSAWRVIVDAAAKAYQIQRRSGERWSVVASFSVRLSPCKPAGPR
jgi:hypothetical protein